MRNYPSLAASSRQALETLTALNTTLQKRYSSHAPYVRLDDILQRYTIWAGNIGALHELQNPRSLEYRVRTAPKLRARFAELLGDVRDDLDELKTLLERVSESGDSDTSKLEAEFNDIIETLDESIRSLFKTSGIARKAAIRDRYALALKKVDASQVAHSDHDFDLIGDLFPRLRVSTHDWLRTRLAAANSLRRRYLHYCESHQTNVRLGTTQAQFEVVDEVKTVEPLLDLMDEARTEKSSQFAKSTATTVNAAVYEDMETSKDDVESLVSAFSYATDSAIPMRYKIIDLENVNGGQDDFICPYCRKELSYTSQDRWKKHVLTDLKAYVCLDKECDTRLFEDSRSWMHHQLTSHLTRWVCPYCEDEERHDDLGQFKEHLHQSHATRFREQQIEQICKVSEQAPDVISVTACPFCDWRTKLEYSDPKRYDASEVTVTLQRYRRHIGSHMEQAALAILAIEDDQEQDPDAGESESFGTPSITGTDPQPTVENGQSQGSDAGRFVSVDYPSIVVTVPETTPGEVRQQDNMKETINTQDPDAESQIYNAGRSGIPSLVVTSPEPTPEEMRQQEKTQEAVDVQGSPDGMLKAKVQDLKKILPLIVGPTRPVSIYFDRPALAKALRLEMTKPSSHTGLAHAVAVTGLNGSGKRQLVRSYIKEYKKEYDVIFWLDASSMRGLRSSFEQCYTALHGSKPPATTDDARIRDMPAVKAVLNWLTSRWEEWWLVVFDQADDTLAELRWIMPESQTGAVVIISRDPGSWRVFGSGCETVAVDMLDAEEALAFFQSVLKYGETGDGAEYTKLSPEFVQQIADRLPRLPNALAQLAHSIRRLEHDDIEQAVLEHLDQQKKSPSQNKKARPISSSSSNRLGERLVTRWKNAVNAFTGSASQAKPRS